MLSRREAKQFHALRLRKAREAQGLFLAEGIRTVEDLLASRLRVRLAASSSSLEDTERGVRLLQAIAAKGVEVRDVTDAELGALAGTDTPQGIVVMAESPSATLDDLHPPGIPVDSPRPSGSPASGEAPSAIVVLDAVQDPGNLGTLLRTAEALGAAGAVLLPGTVDAWNPKAVRAAMGASFRLPVVEVGWDALEPWLRARGFAVLAAAGEGALLGERPVRAALVLGNEGAGVGDETRRRADRLVGIPLRGRAESLNVAAAGAILLHELLR
ncbi:MAG: hypothetical protein JWM27_2004 [Gemmatimonadetes bacterium]|nr:hypothetical protein [Gemmatimonadota bacterium]